MRKIISLILVVFAIWPRHNPEVWHEGHGDDPSRVNDIFGKIAQEIAYPWQTVNENKLKHDGYKWAVERDLPCDEKGYCVKAFRVQYHMHPAMDMNVRWHSALVEIQVCKDSEDEKTCGIIRSGGWFDFGYLYRPEKNENCEKQQDRVETGQDEKFFTATAETKSDIVDEMRCHAGDGIVKWWGHGGSDIRFQITRINDRDEVKIGYFLPVNKYYVDGYFNNGVVNMPLGARYVDRFGKIVVGCSVTSLDCIPIEYSNIYLSGDIEKEVVGFQQVDR